MTSSLHESAQTLADREKFSIDIKLGTVLFGTPSVGECSILGAGIEVKVLHFANDCR